MKVGDLVRIRGRTHYKDYGLVIKANKKGDVIDVLTLSGTWKGKVWCEESFGWEVISESR